MEPRLGLAAVFRNRHRRSLRNYAASRKYQCCRSLPAHRGSTLRVRLVGMTANQKGNGHETLR